VKQNKVNK